MKLRGAVEENSSITQEIASMKMTLMKLQTERLKAGGKAAHEVDAALAKVGPASSLCCLTLLMSSQSLGPIANLVYIMLSTNAFVLACNIVDHATLHVFTAENGVAVAHDAPCTMLHCSA